MQWLQVQMLLLDTARGVVGFAWNWLLQSTLLIAGGLVVGRLLSRRGSAVQSLVYRTTLAAALVCPLATWTISLCGFSGWSVEMPSGWFTVSDERDVTEPVEPPRRVSESSKTSFDASAHSINVSDALVLDATEVIDPVEQPLVENAAASSPVHVFGKLAIGATLLWLLTATWLSAQLAWAWSRMNAIRATASRAELATLRICRELSAKLAVAPPDVLHSPYLPSPCLAGMLRPAVLLPEAELSLSTRDVLIHELAHLKRRDCHWNLLRKAATAVFFFQPLLWRLSHRLEVAAEEVCDDFVVQYGGDRAEYANRLIDVAEFASAPMATAAVAIVSLRSMLARRVARIMDTSRSLSTRVSRLLVLLVLVVGFIGTAIIGLVGAVPQRVAGETPEAKQEAATNAEQPDAPNAEAIVSLVAGLRKTEDAIRNLSVTTNYVKLQKFGLPVDAPVLMEMVTQSIVEPGGRASNDCSGEQVNIEPNGKDVRIYKGRWRGTFDGAVATQLEGSGNQDNFQFASLDNTLSWHGINPLEFTTHYFGKPVSDLLRQPGVVVVGVVPSDGREFIVVETAPTKANRKYQFWIDVERSIVTRRAALIQFAAGQKWQEYTRTESSKHEEVAPGTWLPMNVKYESIEVTADSKPEELSWSYSGTNSEWKVNQELPADTFTLQIPQGATVNDHRQPVKPTFFISKHVIVHENRVIAWDDIPKLLKEMANKGPLDPSFMASDGVVDRMAKLQEDISRLSKELHLKGYSFGLLSRPASRRYDAIRTQQDLEPDESQKRKGTVLLADGTPVAEAEVVLLPNDDAKINMPHSVVLEDGRVRLPEQEIVTRTDATGRFAVYSNERFQLVVLHKSGFALVNSEELERESAIKLKPWVHIRCTIDLSGHPKQGMNILSVLHQADGWPRIELTDSQMQVAEDGIFDRGTIAAGDVAIRRYIQPFDYYGNSGSSKAVQIRDAKPGSEHRITIGPFTDAAPVPETPKKEETSKNEEAPKRESGLNILKRIREASAPILAEMAEKHGYSLAEGQSLKRVAPPFDPIRMKYYRVGDPTQAELIPAGPSAMTFRWDGKKLQGWGKTFGDPKDDGYDLSGALDALHDIKIQQIEGPEALLRTRLLGDWVIRPGLSDEKFVQEFQSILLQDFQLPIHIEFRTVDREVYVASGRYRFKPIDGQPSEDITKLEKQTVVADPVQVFGKELVPDSGAGGGMGDFQLFLQWLGRWIESPVVDETTEGPQRKLCWRLHESNSGSTPLSRKEAHDPALVLRNIEAQTGLKFTKERRPVKILFVENQK